MGTVSHQLQQQTNPKKDGDPKVERLEGHLIVFAPGSTGVVDYCYFVPKAKIIASWKSSPALSRVLG